MLVNLPPPSLQCPGSLLWLPATGCPCSLCPDSLRRNIDASGYYERIIPMHLKRAFLCTNSYKLKFVILPLQPILISVWHIQIEDKSINKSMEQCLSHEGIPNCLNSRFHLVLSKMGQLTSIRFLYQACVMVNIYDKYIHCVYRCIFVTFGSNMTVANMACQSQSKAEITVHWPSASMSTLSQSYSSGVMGHLNSAPGRVPCWAPCPAARGAPTNILREKTASD